MKKTQNERILKYLKTHKSGINPRIAMIQFGCMRLASRISDIKKMGYSISREMIAVRNQDGDTCYVANYKLVE